MRIDIKRFAGDVAVASQALVIGRRWCFDMERQINAGIPVSGQRQDVVQLGEAEASIRARVYRDIAGDLIGEVWIEALGGCSDIAPFLLKRNGRVYYAYYNDGQVETINPVTRTPRPDPDPAVRTKKVKVPDELLDGSKRGSMFSGLMRMAVQCAHARGVDTVFSYTWGKTHGIVEYLDQAPANSGSSAAVAAQSAKNRYWVVEISAAGVYAAPISWSGKCCDGFLVRQYLATTAQVQASPGLGIYQSELSLQWAYSQGRAGVRQLIPASGMTSAYSADPFYTQQGWAFSRSGLHAQQVTAASTGLHYETKRWKIDFTVTVVNNTPTLSAAAINMVESGQVVFPSTDPHWIPTDNPGEWSAIPRFTTTDLTGSYSGPIHVFYQGETEFVTRYQNTGTTTFPTQTSGDFTGTISNCPIRQYPRDGVAVLRCGVVPSGWETGSFPPTDGATKIVDSAFTGRKSGYVTNHTSAGPTASTTRDFETWTSFVDGSSNDSIIPSDTFAFACCSATMNGELRRNYNLFGYTDIFRSGSQNGYSAAILMKEEREGILILNKTAGSGTQRYTLFHNIVVAARDWSYKAYGTPPPGACWSDFSGTGSPPGTGETGSPGRTVLDTFNGGSQDPDINTSFNDSSGTYDLVVGSQHFSGALPTSGGFVRTDIDKAFINTIPPVNLNLNLLAFHGAMYYAPADPAATQPNNFPPLKDQRTNAVWLFPDNLHTVGGFTNDGTTPVAFVGQA